MSTINKKLFHCLNFKDDYEWKTKNDGTPNMTSFKNKENLINILTRLNNFYNRNKQQNNKENFLNNNRELNDCPICMEPIAEGIATLNCNHSMCIDCFANHSRINNTCPLCRDPFASKVKKQEHMLDETLDCIIDTYLSDHYINNCLELINQIDIIDANKTLEYRNKKKFIQIKEILKSACKYFMKIVVDWYKSW